MRVLKLNQIMAALNSLAPWDLAEEWDRVGLEIGRLDQAARRILAALDMNEGVLEEGLDRKVDGFIVHHPFFFNPLSRVDTSSASGRILARLLKEDLFLIAAHTNMDKAAAGLNQYLAELFGLRQVRTLDPVRSDAVKIVVFAPETDAPRLREAMAAAGAGRIGAYSECAFQMAGIGSFIPGDAAQPIIGQHGQRTEVGEIRLEMLAANCDLERIVKIIRQNHPYEEPAIDVYPLATATPPQDAPGLGRIGCLREPARLDCLCQQVKETLKINSLRVSGPVDRMVARIALCSGSGGNLLRKAIRQGADVYLTGELHYHDYLTAAEAGIAVIEAGHWGTEHLFSLLVTRFLEAHFREAPLEVVGSRFVTAEPFIIL